MAVKESAIQRQIIEFLSLYPNKVYVFPFRQQARFDPRSGKMFFGSVIPGIPDLVGWRNVLATIRVKNLDTDKYSGIFGDYAQFLGIEVKTPISKKAWLRMDSGHRKPDKRFLGQRDFRDKILKAGGIWALADSVEDVKFLVGRG